MKESDENSFHVGSVFILISHNHETTVTKRFQIRNGAVISAMLKTDNSHDLLDVGIVLNLENERSKKLLN